MPSSEGAVYIEQYNAATLSRITNRARFSPAFDYLILPRDTARVRLSYLRELLRICLTFPRRAASISLDIRATPYYLLSHLFLRYFIEFHLPPSIYGADFERFSFSATLIFYIRLTLEYDADGHILCSNTQHARIAEHFLSISFI